MPKYIQPDIFSVKESPKAQKPCVTCSAKRYDEGRFYKLLGCCVYCAMEHDSIRKSLARERPVDPMGCQDPPRSKSRIDVYAKRYKLGLSIFSPFDNNQLDEAPAKRRGLEGETGIERSGDRWRARTYWRGRKWMLGSYDHEEEALSRVRDFWKIFRDVNLAPPPLWMPCADGDRAFAIEDLHLKMWSQQYPDVNALAVCKKYASELSRNRKKPNQIDVWNTLVDRLEQEQSSTMSADDNRVFDYVRG